MSPVLLRLFLCADSLLLLIVELKFPLLLELLGVHDKLVLDIRPLIGASSGFSFLTAGGILQQVLMPVSLADLIDDALDVLNGVVIDADFTKVRPPLPLSDDDINFLLGVPSICDGTLEVFDVVEFCDEIDLEIFEDVVTIDGGVIEVITVLVSGLFATLILNALLFAGFTFTGVIEDDDDIFLFVYSLLLIAELKFGEVDTFGGNIVENNILLTAKFSLALCDATMIIFLSSTVVLFTNGPVGWDNDSSIETRAR